MSNPKRILTWAGALVLAGLAVGLRVYRFEVPHTSIFEALQARTLPPGLHLDEAFNLLAALRLLRGGEVEPFIRIDLGKLPIHIYLTALIFSLAGPITVGGRIATLIGGLGCLLVIGPLVHAAFAETLALSERRVLAWIVTGQMAVTYWFVHFSRLGMEHMMLALFSSLAMLGLWWAARSFESGKGGIAGGLLGLALYTYPAAYFVPVVAVLILAYLWLAHCPPARVRLRFGLFYAAGFLLAALPLFLFFLRYPEWITSRPGAVAARSWAGLASNGLNTLAGLGWRGDTNVSYNLPGRPFLDGIQALFFLLGLGVCLRRIRQPAYAFGPVWMGVMLLPEILSDAPHFGRMSGATIPILLITAVGGLTLWRTLSRFSRSSTLATGALAGFTLISAGLTARDYFVRWPQSSDLLRTFRVAERMEAELAQHDALEGSSYLSPIDRELSTIDFILEDEAETRVRSFNGRVCSVLPPQRQPAHYFLTAYEETLTAERLALMYGPALPTRSFAVSGAEQVRQIDVPDGQTLTMPPGSLLTPRARAGELMQPEAVILPSVFIYPGGQLPVRLIWQVVGQTDKDFTLGLYLLGPNFPAPGFSLWSQYDRQPCDASYPTSRWTPGEWIIEDRVLSLPPEMPSGDYALAAALYTLSDGARLPVTNSEGSPIGDLLPLAQLSVPPR